jgi:hypothetical protein
VRRWRYNANAPEKGLAVAQSTREGAQASRPISCNES